MEQPLWKKNDRVTWHQRMTWSTVSPLPAIVKQVSNDEVMIEILFRLGDQWVTESRRVPPDSLVQRRRYIKNLDHQS